jgi:transcriptional regulator with GAF, ATPase, and Fis domain
VSTTNGPPAKPLPSELPKSVEGTTGHLVRGLRGEVARLERALILGALRIAHGSQKQAANLLQLNERQFRYLRQKYNLPLRSY